MKAKDKETLTIIRMLNTALQNEQMNSSAPLSTEQEITKIAREMKQRRDSLAEFEKANLLDLLNQIL